MLESQILTLSSLFRYLSPLFVLGSLLSLAVGQTVRVPERIEVTSEILRLGDIARIEPESGRLSALPIGYSPYPGHYRWLDKSYLLEQLTKGGVDLHEVRLEMPERVLVTRLSQVVGQVAVREAVLGAFEALGPDLSFDVTRIDVPQDVMLPRGELEIRVGLPSPLTRLDGLSLKLDFFVDGKLARSQWARIYASALAKVVVLARPVAFGQRLQRADLTLEERSLRRLESFYSNPERVVNLVAKRGLEAGQVLDSSHLKTPKLVARNDTVTIIAQGKTFRVSTLGKARDGGTLGDTIQVENLDSHQLLRVEVIGNKTVRVALPGEIG